MLVFALLFCGALVSTKLYAQDFYQQRNYPQYVQSGYVNDLAHLLSNPDAVLLNRVLPQFEAKTRIKIIVVTVNYLDREENIRNYMFALKKTLGIGNYDQNNYVIFLIAPNDGGRMEIDVAPGLRGIIPDNIYYIVNERVQPYFNAGRVSQGIAEGTLTIAKVADNNLSALSRSQDWRPRQEWNHNQENRPNHSKNDQKARIIQGAIEQFLRNTNR